MPSLGIAEFAKLVPASLLAESGKVFYSGRQAFDQPARLYVIGINPGGAPESYPHETVGRHTNAVLHDLSDDWSAYRDESWEGASPGTYGMAPRVLHLFNRLELSAGSVPASNLIFVRSRREHDIRHRQAELADLCWAFHAAVITQLKIEVVVCFGSTAGEYVRKRLYAHELVDEFVERNNRRWRSRTYRATDGRRIVVATHPSIADWTSVPTDPSDLVRTALRLR
jgi:hypothetical protein